MPLPAHLRILNCQNNTSGRTTSKGADQYLFEPTQLTQVKISPLDANIMSPRCTSAIIFHGRRRTEVRWGSSETMKMRIIVLAVATLLLSGFTQAELEKAKNAKEFFKDSYWKCLATEVVRIAPTNMSVQDFSAFIRGVCRRESNDFFLSLSDYIVMLQPNVDRSTVPSAVNIAIKAAQDDAVKVLIDLRSRGKGN
jgi:hypothetical protein